MDYRYLVLNMENEEEECNVFRNLRLLSSYVNDMYSIQKSHMYYHRKLTNNNPLYLDKLLILKFIIEV